MRIECEACHELVDAKLAIDGGVAVMTCPKCDAKFDWAVTEIPYWDDVAGAPQNAIIGGASLWVMGGKTNNAYKGVAKFFGFLSRPALFHVVDYAGSFSTTEVLRRTLPQDDGN